ncbi:MAG: HD domain-containing protein [Muribaculaceae bacterium]|nr:HD domain-containing protein [Muribaculaceae bacterium]
MNKIDKEAVKAEFIEMLRSTEREGVDYVLEEIERLGFFEAPASANHHLNTEGGLTQHSLNVAKASLAVWESMKTLEPTLEKEVTRDSIIISALLHDICKSDIYRRSVKKKRNAIGQWEDSEGYKLTYKNFPMGHGEKSLVIALYSGLELSDAEMLAIRWHMGAWGVNQHSIEDCKNYDVARKLYPLVSIIQTGDSLAASIMERETAELDEA